MAERPLPAYDGEEPYIFVTYAHEDAELAHSEIRWLQDQSFNVWWDEGISPGAAWRAELAEAIQKCSLLLYFITPRSVMSEHCTREVHFALDEHHRPVLAVHLVETALPGAMSLSLSDRQAILKHSLEPVDYERKLVSAVATYLDQPLPEIPQLTPPRRTSRQISLSLAIVCSLLILGIAIASVWFAMLPGPVTPRPMSVFTLDLPAGVTLPGAASLPFAISQDGRQIVFSGTSKDGNRLYVRSLDDFQASPIRGTEGMGVSSVFMSPDGKSVMMFDPAARALKKVSVSGGAPVAIVKDIGGPTGLSWGQDGTIVISTLENPALLRVTDSGGPPEPLTQPGEGEVHSRPSLLADGSAVVFQLDTTSSAGSRIAVLSLLTGEQRILTEGSLPQVTSTGHLLFARDKLIWAMAFDKDQLEVSGRAVPVLEDVSFAIFAAQFSVAEKGAMVYLPAASKLLDSLTWTDFDGNEAPLSVSPDLYITPRVSPDGDRIVVGLGDEIPLWVYSIERGIFTKLTESTAVIPLWSPDGTKVMYSLFINGVPTLHLQNADGTGDEVRLTQSPRFQWATSWSGGANEVIFFECDAWLVACDLGRLTLTDEPTAELFLETEFNEMHPVLSNDDRWIAYESDRSGVSEIYVRPYPEVDAGLWKISTKGGKQPLWSHDGKTLYYSTGNSAMNRQLMSVAIQTNSGFVAGSPQSVFDFSQAFNADNRNYDLHPDDQRFVMVKPFDPEARGGQALIFVENWLDEVKRLVPTD